MAKGALPYTGRCMSKSKALLTGSGKMSSAHGLNTGNKYHGVRNAGETTVGKNVRSFKSGLPGKAGYDGGGTAHAKQPK